MKWFPDRRGLAAGMTAAGFGAGSALTVIPIANMIANQGYQDAFWYFGKAYGIQFLAPIGISTEAEASAQKVAELINLIKEKNIKAVFVENLASPRLLQQIAEETGVILQGTLYADSLSAVTGPAVTYEAMMRHNVTTISKALQYTHPK